MAAAVSAGAGGPAATGVGPGQGGPERTVDRYVWSTASAGGRCVGADVGVAAVEVAGRGGEKEVGGDEGDELSEGEDEERVGVRVRDALGA